MQSEKEDLLEIYELSERLKKSVKKLHEATRKIFEIRSEKFNGERNEIKFISKGAENPC